MTKKILAVDVIKSLEHGICKVRFTKNDGAERTMNCTLKENITPTNAGGERNGTIVVYDTDKRDWRSFRIESVLEFAAHA